jgi:hypothetical protein
VTSHADEVAGLLDAPRVKELLMSSRRMALAKECPPLALGLTLATKRKHAEMTTRHVVVAMVDLFERLLTEAGLSGLGDLRDRAQAVLDTAPLRVGRDVVLSARLAGAVAGAVARPQPHLTGAVVREALAGDERVAFAKDALEDARARLLAAKAAKAE